MSKQIYRLTGTVISVFNIEDFEGVVIPTFTDPNFVVAIRIDDSQHPVDTDNPDIRIPVFDVVFYAVPSISGLFGRSDVVGEVFTLAADVDTIDGQEWHFLSLA